MTTLRYVNHHRVLDYARLGWSIADTLSDIWHGQYSILMIWLCHCPCLEPVVEGKLPSKGGANTMKSD
jgi:hypothetical protein